MTFRANQASDDALDAQTDAKIEYRKIGDPSWIEIADLGTSTTGVILAGTLPIGSYEWRSYTKADGLWGPASAIEYFRTDNPAQEAVVTEPESSTVVVINSFTTNWEVISQYSYQLRLVNANSDNPTTIYVDSGEQISSDRTRVTIVNVNHISAWVQLRIRDKSGGVWSPWVSVPITIEWVGPPKPRVVVTTSTDQIGITIVNPSPVGIEPEADRNDIYVIEDGIRERRAMIPPKDSWVYETPPSGVNVGIEVVAVYTPTNVSTSSGVIYQ